MTHPNQAFGIMDEAYFVPRSEILEWLNNLLHIKIPKIQALGAGNVYCQILDVIHPDKVAMNKLNWKAKLDYEFISNLKVLQSAFDKLGIKKYIDVEKIARAKYQDNLQLIQWFKRYYDVNCGGRGENYPAQQRRGFEQPDFSFSEKTVVPKTYNGSGQCTYNSANQLRPTKQLAHDIKHQAPQKTTGTTGVYYQSHNTNSNNFKPAKTKSASDEKLEAIVNVLKSQMTNDEKVTRIQEITDQTI